MKEQENSTNTFEQFAKKSDKVTLIDGSNSIIYTRVSGKEQEKNMSLTWQKKYCEELCKRNGYSVLEYFGGTFESAKTDERKEFQKMLDFIKKSKNKVNNLIVYSLDRFSRAGSTWLIDQLRGWGVRIISVTQPADANTANGRWYQKMQLLIAELDNEQRRDKCVTGMREKLLKGEWISKPSLGYDKVKVAGKKPQCVINEKGKLIRKAFQWRADENVSHEEILRRLEKMGLSICKQKLSKIFRNPFYCGYITNQLIDGKVVKGVHEPIVSEEIFLKVNGLLKAGNKHQNENNELPLKIFVKCEDCGSSFCGYEVKKKKLFYYKCKKAGCKCNRSVPHMHRIFANKLQEYSITSTMIEPLKKQLAATYYQLCEQEAANEKPLKDQLADLKKNLQSLKERWALGKISEEVYHEFAPQYRSQISAIEEKLDSSGKDSSNLHEYLQIALEGAMKLLPVWTSLDYAAKQRLQYLLFPEGAYYNRKTDSVRTPKVNFIFSEIARLAGGSAQKEKGTNHTCDDLSPLAERKGFEPLIGFLLYTLSRRASSTTPAPLREGCKNKVSLLTPRIFFQHFLK